MLHPHNFLSSSYSSARHELPSSRWREPESFPLFKFKQRYKTLKHHLFEGWQAATISAVSGKRLKTAHSAHRVLNCHCPNP